MAIALHYVDRQVTRSYALPMSVIRQIPSLLRMTTTTEGNIDLPTWGLALPLSLKRRAKLQPHSASDQCSCGLAMAGHPSAYNEEAFRYLLAIERERSEHS